LILKNKSLAQFSLTMSKKNKNRPKPQAALAPSVQPATLETRFQAANKHSTHLLETANEEFPEVVDPIPHNTEERSTEQHDLAPSVSDGEPVNLEENLRRAETLNKKLNETIERLRRQERLATDRETKVKEKSDQLSDLEAELKSKDVVLKKREGDLVGREELVASREADAEAGFMARRAELLSKLEVEIKGYADSLAKHEESLRQARQETLEMAKAERDQIEQSRLALEEQAKSQLREIAAHKRQLEWASDELQSEKLQWKQRIEEQVAIRVSSSLSEREALLAEIGELRRQLSALQEVSRQVGNRTPEDLLSEINSLQNELRGVRDELYSRPSNEQQRRIPELITENDSLRHELTRLQQENQSLHLRMGKASIGIAEIESLRDQRSAWEIREQALRARVQELKTDLGELIDQSSSSNVFPECSRMDVDEALQTQPRLLNGTTINLKGLVELSRNLIATKALYYSSDDIRAFLAGLAANRLHILQGISGTGKTSLPYAIAQSLGWGHSLIEVQSGWRDRQDLLGYFNSFERKFYESPFLKALYRASCPEFSSVPYLIVLDEMNLSHPEHYFADFLSAIEQPEDPKTIPLLASRPSGGDVPRHFLENGQRLVLPPNVWFIGTANQDETTKDFADKTYDRANVMEFPRHPEKFTPKSSRKDGTAIGLDLLENSFQAAASQQSEFALAAKSILNGQLSTHLEKLAIGWGNRLERQIDRYIPVIIASGGTLSEGIDNLLAHKLLRKIKGRFDITSDQISSLKSAVETVWGSNSELSSELPVKSLGLLEKEEMRLQ
jgi:hypothetical protein